MKPASNAKKTADRLGRTFAALADPTRRAILAKLAMGEASVKELAEPFAMSQPAISKHLSVLERAGLIARGREAQRRPSRVVTQPIDEAMDWLDTLRQTLEANFDRLDALLEELQAIHPRMKKHRRPRARKARP
jgi:DNA-binding transcriptional ArsR family regulator